ncbi:MAG TPA: hypothetical protein LFW21_00065 [Rickettsia endosymbiont of Pyrocoelia pectoralis]|nr:hypothetical protein [Rickettsia endosymbiont of Pyrocoelia pectoralis]
MKNYRLNKLQKQKAQYIKDAEEQRKINEKLVSKELEQGKHKLSGIETKIKQTDVKLAAIHPEVKEAKQMKDEVDKQVRDAEKTKEKTKETKKEIIKKIQEIDPKQYNAALDDFSTLLLNSINETKANEINTPEQNNKSLENTDKKEPPITLPGKPNSDIILPGKEEILSSQKPIIDEISATTQKLSHGEEALKLAENRPVPKDKTHKHASNIKTSLEKQQPSINNKKETQVNKLLTRVNQQTKKNEGHSR